MSLRRTLFFQRTHEPLAVLDADYQLLEANPAFYRAMGRALDSRMPVSLIELLIPADRATVLHALDQLPDKGHVCFHARMIAGPQRWLHWLISADSETGVAYVVAHDYDGELNHRIHYDQVTGLLNRISLTARIDSWISDADGTQPFAVCLFDLDRFNRINDALGHTLGDELLTAVGRRLRDNVPAEAVLARMGGDEFALLTPAADEAQAYLIASRMLHVLEQPFSAGEHTLYLSAGAGVSLYPRDGTDSEALLKHADSAIHLAKSQGRNTVRIFTPELASASQARLELDMQLRRAIDGEEFVLHYQPQIDLHNGRVVGVESLIRWQHPSRGLLPPAAFIDAAEESHLMPRIARWVIRESCRQAVSWQQTGHPPIRMAVNVSAPQFEVDDIVAQVTSALSESGLAPQWFDLEITESMLMRNPEDSAAKIMRLRALGVRVTIDDFGTGYSSLAYLQQFPVDTLKIDRSFVKEISNDDNGRSLIRAIVGLAHSLGLTVVAEGVETPAQYTYLRRIGCNEAQGYLFAYPLPADHVWAAISHLHQYTG